MKKSNLNPYDLNRTEYAELLGITPNARLAVWFYAIKDKFNF